MLLVLLIVLLRSTLFTFGKCIECKISCTSDGGESAAANDGTFYVGLISTQYSTGQTISSSKYDTISGTCKYCFTAQVLSSCPTTTSTISCTCSKTETSNEIIDIIEEEVETLLEEGTIASAGVLAVAALLPPPLPMFPPLGLPQPIAFQDGITRAVFQGTIEAGVLPSTILTVNNWFIIHPIPNCYLSNTF